MSSMNPAKFVREVRQEMSRVSWPSRRETTISVFMVVTLAAVASIFFLFADWIISTAVRVILGIGG